MRPWVFLLLGLSSLKGQLEKVGGGRQTRGMSQVPGNAVCLVGFTLLLSYLVDGQAP